MLNWNNKPAPGWEAGEDNLSYGSVHRVEAFYHFPKKARIQDVVSIMNKAATEDVTATQVWPVIHDVLASGKAPNDQARLAEQLVTAWTAKGASRLDGDLDGKIDDPGAAILDVAFTKMATAALGARLGVLTDDLSKLQGVDQNPQGRNGSSFGGGWYGYVDKDLRALLSARWPAGSRSPTAAAARWRPAAPSCGPRSTPPTRSSPPRRAPTRARGAPTRRRSGSSSRRG